MERFSHLLDLSSHELAADESFQSYVSAANEDDVAFWEAFVAMHPDKQATIDQAREMLNLLRFRRRTMPEAYRTAVLNDLLSALGQHGPAPEAVDDRRHLRRGKVSVLLSSPLLRMAAAVAGLLCLVSATLFFIGNEDVQRITHRTGYGEHLLVRLPDSSLVTLNANTTLTLDAGWNGEAAREVWLDGEAFFEVTHKGQARDARFIVHTPGMDVEVLGTKFNVFNRKDKANVILNSGKVAVSIASAADTSLVVMHPDESLEFIRSEHTIQKKQVKAEVLTSWRNQIWQFENTPLSRIAEMLEQTFGVTVVFGEGVDANEALVGTIPSENLEVLLKVLAKSSNLNIARNGDRIIINKMNSGSQEH